ncbi:MAG: ribose ABC transporter permease [Sphaerochaetaceae bacterium]|jgi:ribose transport system permease protein|nr:ribose ABC transporter permease [Sphaerochaetaceae bacterium]
MNKLTNKSNMLQEYGSQIALVLLLLLLSIISPEFRTVNNLLSLLRQSSVNGLIAFGMTVVILTGGIDLSVGSTLALTALLGAGMLKGGVPAPIAILLVLIIGIALGVLNGVMVVNGKIQPFIATLVSMTAFRGIAMIFSDGRPISRLGDSSLLAFLGQGKFLGIPVPVWIMIILFFIFRFFLQNTVIGRDTYATGSNDKAAALAGISIAKVKYLVYAVSGFTAAFAGLILVSRLGSAQPTLGSGYELDAIAAVAVGGTSMNGGRGKILGTLTGVIIIAALNNGMNIIGISSYYQQVVKAIVILLAVLSDRHR